MKALTRQCDRLIIGVMGASDSDSELYELAEEVGRLIATRGAVVLTGGRDGVMEAAAKGAHQAGGLTIGILKGVSRKEATPNPFIHVALRTGMGEGRNYINIAASDAIIAIGGEWGTLSEVAMACKLRKPVVLLRSGFDLKGHRKLVSPPVASSAAEAVEMALAAAEPG
jgi:uncharacterized protein (TIGR00725 family)